MLVYQLTVSMISHFACNTKTCDAGSVLRSCSINDPQLALPCYILKQHFCQGIDLEVKG